MAQTARKEAQARRNDARKQRRDLAAQPFEELDEAAQREDGDGAPDFRAAATKAAATAAVGAIAGGLGAAVRVLMERRAHADDGHTDSADETEREPQRPAPGPAAESESAPATEGSGTTGDESASEIETEPEPMQQQRDTDEPPHGASSSDVASIIENARRHVEEVLGGEPESISGVERTNGAWTVMLEVLEMRRIPESTDVLSSYEVVLDEDGNLVRLGRVRRYRRSQVEEQ